MERLSPPVKQYDKDILNNLALEIRKSVFETIINANSGHLGGNSSCIELLTCLYFGGVLKFDPANPQDKNRDRVLILGHKGPVRYKIFSLMGLFSEDELKTYRQFGSRLQGHEDMHTTPGVDITPSGSLGMILSYGVGDAIVAKEKGSNHKTFVFLGDGEEQEGNISEAARHAANLGLDNLICILDKNDKQLSRPTNESDSGSDVRRIWEGYGWNVLEISDGHNVEEIMEVYSKFEDIQKPTFVIAHTIKGRGISGAEENFCGYHTLSVTPKDLARQALELSAKEIKSRNDEVQQAKLLANGLVTRPEKLDQSLESKVEFPNVNIAVNPDDETNLDNSQGFYFKELRSIIEADNRIKMYVITPDFIRKDLVEMANFERFTKFIDTGIREQHAVAMAHGISISDPLARIFINFGDAFIYRAMDQLNAVAQGGSKMIIVGEHSGLTQERNGKTHQTSGQPGALINMPGLNIKEPADVQDLFNVLNWAFTNNPGVVYARLHRKNISPLYRQIDDLKNIRHYITHDPGKKPGLVIVSSGFTTHNSVKAAEILESKYNIPTRVVNVISPGELGKDFLNLLENDTPVLTVYNGFHKVLQSVVSMAVMEFTSIRPSVIAGHGFDFGTTGSIVDLERYYQIDELGIVRKAKSLLDK
ncbi:MAG: 1-deoxy-D-xylulose-5-phosphate synthase [Candidatus Woesebacteria bacterium GW2011_GWA2_40_7]|uniref:1-deoxy-D-xylulose-5-phosphate synthase n=3 Tax=Candidatus Woeseibacteriota TaxID=1752722 RepID=A0A0G0UV98_9BACT|nr:MAG: 1-deoxy-D-xylulose-5-phosphate synthase [Candidatus Woesebacteria bacterium GW2011_GWB1_39_10]KKR73023.1 MAG: 1-deoxy-D-xylulose-5-phosphate synthase [Candidatus Woesebacteria bacterium GW2011_GWA2_40_7]KKR92588.1 MAG: 1-deoxy-D-xylulose-5-phosphate synthase [Candidatus Woesebacteria bacterium GW2011_GWA1_41_13b]